MLKHSKSYLTGLCIAGLGFSALSACDKTEEHPVAPEAAPAAAPAPEPAAPVVDAQAEAKAKAEQMQKDAKEARDKAQAELSTQVDGLTEKLTALKGKATGHSKQANLKMKKALNTAEMQLKNLRDETKMLGSVGEDKFVESKERLQKALAIATKAVEHLVSPGSEKKHK